MLSVKSASDVDMINGDIISLRKWGALINAKITRRFRHAPATDKGAPIRPNAKDSPKE